MKSLEARYSLEWVSLLLTTAATLGTIYTFVVGRHYVIPTLVLVLVILMGNLSYFGFRDKQWAKHLLFWLAVLFSFHCFFALFFAVTPRELLGSAFLWIYGVLSLASALAAWKYSRYLDWT